MDLITFKNFYKNKKVLVTGHTGFKGTWLCLFLNFFGAKVIGYSLKPNSYDNYLFYKSIHIKKKIKTYYGNILDKKKLLFVIKKNKPEIFFHLAAQSLVVPSYLNPKMTYETNVIGTLNVLEACRGQNSLRSLIIATSDKCYLNLGKKHYFNESSPLGGNDPYSSSKAMSERLVKIYFDRIYKKSSTGIATVRAGNVIGGGDFSKYRIVPDIINDVISKKKLILRNPKSYRPWQHIFDVISGYLNLALKLSKYKNRFSGPYNFGPSSTKKVSVLNLTKKIFKKFNKRKVMIKYTNKNLFEPNKLDINSNKSRKLLKWKTKYSLPKVIEKTIEWYKVYITDRNEVEQFSKKQIIDYFSKG